MKKLCTLMICAGVVIFAAPTALAGDAPENYFEVQGDAWFVDFNGLSDRVAGEPDVAYTGYFSYLGSIALFGYYGIGYGNADDPTFLGLGKEDDVAPSIQFNYIRNGKHGVGATYFSADASARLRKSYDLADSNGMVLTSAYPDWWAVPWFGFLSPGATFLASDLDARFNAEVTDWSLYYIRVLQYKDEDSYWRALFGWSFLDYDQNDDQYWGVNYDGYTDDYRITDTSGINAHGPMIGLTFSQRLGQAEGLRFHGNATFAYLTGNPDGKRTEIWDPYDYNGEYTVVFEASLDDSDVTVTKLGAELGISYTFNFGLELRGGYKLARWTNIPASPLPSYGGRIEDRSRDISIDGFYLGLGYRGGSK